MKQSLTIKAIRNGGEATVTFTRKQHARRVKIVEQAEYDAIISDDGDIQIANAEELTLERDTLVRKVIREIL